MLTWEELKADKGRKLQAFSIAVRVRREDPNVVACDPDISYEIRRWGHRITRQVSKLRKVRG